VQQGRKKTGDRQTLDAIIGTPLAGEEIAGELFDGTSEVAIFPGELPADPRAVFRGETLAVAPGEADYRFVRFRPPVAELGMDGLPLPLPQIRLDRALQFLIGDKLR
jgi:predicted YcjX-like family ATPase